MKTLFLLLNILIFINFAHAIGNKGPLDIERAQGLKNKKNPVADQIGVDENLGEKIDLDLEFTDEKGQQVKLGKYFNDKPVFLLLIYYECPTLCNLHLNALIKMLKDFEWKIGDKFEFVAVSIDPDESHKLAAKKLDSYLSEYGHPETRDGWHFLTGTKENIDAIADQVGFRFAWDPSMEQWAHPAVGYILTPEGAISYYHYGLRIEPKVLRLSLVEAGDNKIGSIMDRALLFCLQYDPNKKTYAFYAFNLMRVGGFITIVILGIILFRFWKNENNKNK